MPFLFRSNLLVVMVLTAMVYGECLSNASPAKGDSLASLSAFLTKIPEVLKTGNDTFQISDIDVASGAPGSDKAFRAITGPLNWATGYSTLYMGTRKKEFPVEKFLERCRTHIEFARKKLVVGGIRGYIVFLSRNYYVSFANWESVEKQKEGGATPDAKAVVSDGKSFMDDVLWTDAHSIPADCEDKLKNALSRLDP